MVGRLKRKNWRLQQSYAAKQHNTRTWRPAIDKKVLALGQALQEAEKTNQKLTLTNANLRNQVEELTRLQTSWDQERIKLVQENRSTQRTLSRKYTNTKKAIQRLERVLKAAETNKAFRMTENERLRAAFKNEVKAEGERWRLREEKLAAELKEMHEKCNEQEAVIIKKQKQISRFQTEMQALAKENLHTLIKISQREDAHNESERQWKIKCEALEVRLKEELGEWEQSDKEPDCKNKKKAIMCPGEEEEEKKKEEEEKEEEEE